MKTRVFSFATDDRAKFEELGDLIARAFEDASETGGEKGDAAGEDAPEKGDSDREDADLLARFSALAAAFCDTAYVADELAQAEAWALAERCADDAVEVADEVLGELAEADEDGVVFMQALKAWGEAGAARRAVRDRMGLVASSMLADACLEMSAALGVVAARGER